MEKEYKDKVVEVIDILSKTGESLFKRGKILGYSTATDRVYQTVSNEFEWDEFPVAYGILKFGDNSNPNYLILSAILDEKNKSEFSLAHDFFRSFPSLSEFKPSKDRLNRISFKKKDLSVLVENLMKGEILAGNIMGNRR